MTAIDFPHRQAAHCESGVVANMLTAAGLPMSEPMAFGLSSSLTFAYLPWIKMAGLPLIAYRMAPGSIIRGVTRTVGVKWSFRTFPDPAQGMFALDEALEGGQAVGLQTGIYWLPYVPEDMRFHFNAHNLIVSGREGDKYVVADPLFPETNICDRKSLAQARFARGVMAPKGRMYYPVETPKAVDYKAKIPAAIRLNARMMLAPVMRIIGVSGIRFLGRAICRIEARKGKDDPYLKAYLGHIVRMQEEIGTGGAGFRFIYAAFLKESADLLGRDDLAEASAAMTDAGDEWRRFALHATKMCRGRKAMDAFELADDLNRIADRERTVWLRLQTVR